MSVITTIGLDLAKNVFQLHGADQSGKAVLRKKLRRDSAGRTVAIGCGLCHISCLSC